MRDYRRSANRGATSKSAEGEYVEDRADGVGVFPLRAQRPPIVGEHRPVLRCLVDWKDEAPKGDEFAHEQQKRDQRQGEWGACAAERNGESSRAQERCRNDQAEHSPVVVIALHDEIVRGADLDLVRQFGEMRHRQRHGDRRQHQREKIERPLHRGETVRVLLSSPSSRNQQWAIARAIFAVATSQVASAYGHALCAGPGPYS